MSLGSQSLERCLADEAVTLGRYANARARDVHFRSQNYQELFNLRHARARNAVERIFGVVKRQFQLLVAAPEYSTKTQAKLVLAICALHNFIGSYDPDDAASYDISELDRDSPFPQAEELGHNLSQQESRRANSRRDMIAKEMWEQYQEYLQVR